MYCTRRDTTEKTEVSSVKKRTSLLGELSGKETESRMYFDEDFFWNEKSKTERTCDWVCEKGGRRRQPQLWTSVGRMSKEEQRTVRNWSREEVEIGRTFL